MAEERYLNQFPPRNTEDESLKQCSDEESRLRSVIQRRFAEREAEFDLALHTGMRFSEQYNLRGGRCRLRTQDCDDSDREEREA